MNGSADTESSSTDLRLTTSRGLKRGPRLEIEVDGRPVLAFAGETVGAVLMAAGQRAMRSTPVGGDARGLFCGIGFCYDCLVVVDGVPSRRACMTIVQDAMRVQTQVGLGPEVPVPEAGR